MTTKRMMMESAKLSLEKKEVTPEMAAAASNMMIMGSAIWAKKRLTRESLGASASRFLPSAASLRSASSEVSPLWEEDISARTASLSIS